MKNTGVSKSWSINTNLYRTIKRRLRLNTGTVGEGSLPPTQLKVDVSRPGCRYLGSAPHTPLRGRNLIWSVRLCGVNGNALQFGDLNVAGLIIIQHRELGGVLKWSLTLGVCISVMPTIFGFTRPRALVPFRQVSGIIFFTKGGSLR